MQGQPSASGSCINWGIRNADGYHGLGYDHMGGSIASVRDINDAEAADLVNRFTAPETPCTRYHWHVAEGIGGVVLSEFDSLAGRDPRANRHRRVSLLDYETAILIHSVPLTQVQLDEVEDTGAMIVWSPSSNLTLYGVTAPIQAILDRDISVGIGPDWTVSGEDDMLAELRYALAFARGEISTERYEPTGPIRGLDAQRLWEMATSEAQRWWVWKTSSGSSPPDTTPTSSSSAARAQIRTRPC